MNDFERPFPNLYCFKPELIESSFATSIRRAAYEHLGIYNSIKYTPRMYINDDNIICTYVLIPNLRPLYGVYRPETDEVAVSFKSFIGLDDMLEFCRILVMLHELYHVYQFEKLNIHFNSSEVLNRSQPTERAANYFAYSFFLSFKTGKSIDSIPDPGIVTIEDAVKALIKALAPDKC